MAKPSEIRSAIKEIKEAVSKMDSGLIGQYLAHEDEKIRAAAEQALETISQSGAEDNTPAPAEDPNANDISLPRFKSLDEKNVPIHPKNWIAMSHEEMMEYQEKGLLMGYNPKTGYGLIKEGK